MRTLAAVSLSALVAVSTACAGGPIPPNSPAPLTGWGAAQADGKLDSQDDWHDAGCVSFTADAPVGPVPAQACVMNDPNMLYVLVRYAGPFIDTIYNDAGLSLDESGNWVIDAGDDLWSFYQTPPLGSILDHHWMNNSTSGPDVPAGGVNDGAAGFGTTATHVVYELAHPLDTATPHDISVALGDTIGALFYLGIAGTTTMQGAPLLVPLIIAEKPEPVPPACLTRYGDNCVRVPMRPGLIELVCGLQPCVRIDELPRNCLVKFPCPPCPGGDCGPFALVFEGLEGHWDVDVVEGFGKPVRHERTDVRNGVRLGFDPPPGGPGAGMPSYAVVFRLKENGELNRTYRVAARLETGGR